MNATSDPAQLFSGRARAYARFISLFRYQPGLRACFLESAALRSGMRILDAGCGTGAVLLAVREAMLARNFEIQALHGFDLTPAMLDQLRSTLQGAKICEVELLQANVLGLERLPAGWRDYDLIASASMLEYVPRDQLHVALAGLRKLLSGDGRLLLFITRDNWLMRPLIGRLWQSNVYTAAQVQEALAAAGFSSMSFRDFPRRYRHLATWGHFIEARR